MWSWLQKLMRYFQGEEEEGGFEQEVQETRTPAPRQLQAKTKSIYPKEREYNRASEPSTSDRERQFRFPVVPDNYLEQRRKDRENDKRAHPAVQSRDAGTSVRERTGVSRDIVPIARENIAAPRIETKASTHSAATGEKLREHVRRQPETFSDRTSLQPATGAEKRSYQPSEIVSPVYGKITPSTREAEHRIHTTSGIVYPRLEQEEHWGQLKEWEQREKYEAAQDEAAAEQESAPIGDESVEEAVAALIELTASEDNGLGEAAHEVVRGEATVAVTEQAAAELAINEVAAGEEQAAVELATDEVAVAEESAIKELDAAEMVAAEELAVEELAALELEVQEPMGEELDDQEPDELPPAEMIEPVYSGAEAFVAESDAESVDEHVGLADSEHDDAEVRDSEVRELQEEHQLQTAEESQPPYSSALARLLERAEVPQQEAHTEVPAVTLHRPEPMPAVSQSRMESAHNENEGEQAESEPAAYAMPQLDLLNPSPPISDDDDEHTQIQKLLLEETLSNFNVSAQVVGIVKGPSVTRFELQPAPGVKVNKITGLIDDIKLNLAAKDIRIEAPIPGRNAIGIEVPNLSSQPVMISKIIGSEKFQQHSSPLAVALGMDIGGEPIIADIKKMPHGLIAGSTGSGKSVCINSIIVSLLYKATPEQVRLLLIDPKMVELAPYNNLPHLVTPVVTEAKQATASLKWAVEEMEKRYALFVDAGVRDIDRYNQTTDDTLPYIVIVIDELADLMMVSPQDVEDCIIRIAQKARACGIHLLLATQRPSVDVITGNIKANVPTRLAFAVFSQVDSRTILDQSGAERLLGRGDMLFLESGTTPVRLQGNYVSDDEIERITQLIKKQRKPSYLFSKEDLEQQVQSFDMGEDTLYMEALVFVAEQGQASASGLQRRFRVGYNRAARLIEMMEADGYVAGQSGGKARAVLITSEDAHALAEGSTLV